MPGRQWSDGDIVAAMQLWNEEYGRPPTAHDWSHAGEWWPASSVVMKWIGWNKALDMAGLPRAKPFPQKLVVKEVGRDVRRLHRKGLKHHEIADRLDISISSVARALATKDHVPEPRRKKLLKNRTREERIADLRSALQDQ